MTERSRTRYAQILLEMFASEGTFEVEVWNREESIELKRILEGMGCGVTATRPSRLEIACHETSEKCLDKMSYSTLNTHGLRKLGSPALV